MCRTRRALWRNALQVIKRPENRANEKSPEEIKLWSMEKNNLGCRKDGCYSFSLGYIIQEPSELTEESLSKVL